MTALATPPKLQFLDSNGAPLVGGKLYTYAAGTTTPQVTYTDFGGGTPNANPVILDSRGEASVWLGTALYKMALYSATNVLIWTVDNIGGFATLAQLAASSGSNLVGFLQAGTGAVATTVQTKLRESVSVMDFGAVGDGVTDDTVAVQNAINSLAVTGGVVYFPSGEYRIARNIGTNDRWGIKITSSNITLKGDQAFLRRFNTDIVSNANVYPILFVGVPDSNVAPLTTNIIIDSLNFIGEDTRHASSGDSLTDFRNAIEFKNTSDTWVKDCQFTAIDSQAIQYQFPASYDYANSVFYNTTKNYKSKISGCSFIAEPHAVAGRALLHCIVVGGVDFCNIVNNYFEWCDDCVSGEGTYNRYENTENNTYTMTGAAATLGLLKRVGRNIIIADNTVYNSSEHAFYPALMDVTITGNNIRTDESTICIGDMIKIRSRGVTCTGNIVSNYPGCISVNEPSLNVTIAGNTCQSAGTELGNGVIDINSDSLKSYIDNRPWFNPGGTPDYQPMSNISITGNSVVMPDFAVSSVGGRQIKHVAFRVSTAVFNASFPEGQVQGVSISGNTVKGYNVGFYMINAQAKNIAITGNTFYAKEFTTTGFTSSTTLNTYAVMQAYQSGAGESLNSLLSLMFSGNYVFGATNLMATDNGAGTAGTYYTPEGMVGNRFEYIKSIRTADIRSTTAPMRFNNNTGVFFLDRTWEGNALENSLGDGATSTSLRRYTTLWTGSDYRFYTDDAGTFVIL